MARCAAHPLAPAIIARNRPLLPGSNRRYWPTAYTEAMLALSLAMVRVFACTLDLPADYRDGMFAKPEHHIRLNYSPNGEVRIDRVS